MKKVISLIIALMLICCAVGSVSAEISPTASVGMVYIKVDAVPVPEDGGTVTPNINNPGKVEVTSGEYITLTATPSDGYEFDRWEVVYGDFEIIEGDLSSPVLVIKPYGDSNIRVYAHYIKVGEEPSIPDDTKPGEKPDDSTQSPPTGYAAPVCAAVGSVVLMAIGALVVFKKKANA